jgi:palmitoyl-protein thioesterase
VFRLVFNPSLTCLDCNHTAPISRYSVDKSSLDIPVEWIRDVYPDVYIKNVEIGDGVDNSINLGIRKQVMMLCDELKKDEALKDGFNLIGFSQGTILTRGYIEMCNDPPVYNYISWAGPQMGQWGAPGIPELVDEVIAPYIYTSLLQEHFAPAGYWKDPYHREDYMAHSSLLADMNNEREEKNPTYKERLLSLNQMSLVYSPNDDFIYPPQSGWFGFFKWDSDKEIVPLQESDMYKEDWIGLRAIDERGDLFFFNTNWYV